MLVNKSDTEREEDEDGVLVESNLYEHHSPAVISVLLVELLGTFFLTLTSSLSEVRCKAGGHMSVGVVRPSPYLCFVLRLMRVLFATLVFSWNRTAWQPGACLLRWCTWEIAFLGVSTTQQSLLEWRSGHERRLEAMCV